jgi:hypothetical protein
MEAGSRQTIFDVVADSRTFGMTIAIQCFSRPRSRIAAPPIPVCTGSENINALIIRRRFPSHAMTA